MTFHSQFKQDEILETNVFKGFKHGIFMDVGAHDGISLNNTLYFEQTNGWTGYNIEPNQKIFEHLVVNRPSCVNLHLAICNKDGVADFMCNEGYTEMLSGLAANYDDRHKLRLYTENAQYGGKTSLVQVHTKRIETICDEYNITHIHYLSIDVEGAEFDVIQSINFDKVFIDVIEFENNYDDTSAPIVEYLVGKGYIFIHKHLDIFMIHKDSPFLANLSAQSS
jgi:FkbM family methyltransferase